MGRMGELDLPDRLAGRAPLWVTQVGFALLCSAGAELLRALVDNFVPDAGPFSFGLPATLVATLFARWQAGLITAAITILYTWYFVIPVRGSFHLADPAEATRIAMATFIYASMLAIAELFRRAVHRAASERDRQIAERDLLLEEFEHRVKNNFALVTSLLEMQRRRAGDQATADALGAALARVESIARAHRHLYRGAPSPGDIDMAAYLRELCATLAEALFLRRGVTLACDAVHAAMPRDRAVSLGLVLNELVTNAAKHAFEGRDSGSIRVSFAAVGSGWRLTVSDDGNGIDPETLAKGRDGGLGQRLVEAFAKQAGGTIATESGPEGTTVTVELAG